MFEKVLDIECKSSPAKANYTDETFLSGTFFSLKLNFIQENSFSVSILSQLICRVLTHK
jgi:hypothetical protein